MKMNKLPFRWLPLFLAMFMFACQPNTENQAPSEVGKALEAGFKTPPVDARPRGLWTWVNGNYDSAEIWREIRAVKEKGMGGMDIWDAPTVQDPRGIVPIGPDQVSDEFMRGVKIAVEAAKETGIELGYIWNQSVSYLDPEHSHMALYHTTTRVDGSGQQTIDLPFPHMKPHKRFGYKVLQREANGRPKYWDNVAVMAYPIQASDTSLIKMGEIVDLTDKMEGDQLTWDVPEGEWNILRFVWSRTTANGLTPTPATLKPALDFLNPEATEIHLSYLLDLMEKHTGPLENTPIKYMCADSYEFKGLWTPKMPQFFQDSLGYSLVKFLPALKGYTVDDSETTDRFLYDFNNLQSDLVIQNHYAKAKEVCNRYGIGFTSEAAGPGPPVHMDVPMESIKSSGVLSFPRGEFWVTDNGKPREHLQIIKGIASAAHLYDQPYVTAEAFTGVHLWSYGPGDLKPYSDRAFAEGLNRIDFHTFSHTPQEAGLPGWIYSFGNIISENLIWWPKSQGFMDYLGRSSYLLQQGHFVGDALYYHGSAAPFFAKPKHFKPELGLGYDYDICNEDILINRLSVKDGKLVLPHGQQYSVLILPDKDWMPLHILQKIEQLLQDGAIVVGKKPTWANGLGDSEEGAAVRALANKIWEGLNGTANTEKNYGKGQLYWGKTPREVLMAQGITPDITFATASSQDTLDYIHRKVEDGDIYFIRNPYAKTLAVLADVRIKGKRPEIWNPVTGEIQKLSLFLSEDNRTHVPFSFQPNGCLFLIFRENRKAKATVMHQGQTVFPTGQVPESWPFKDLGDGNIRLLEEGGFTIEFEGEDKKTLNQVQPKKIAISSEPWQIHFRDPWGEEFTVASEKLQSWSDFEESRIQFFSGSATYENNFELRTEGLNDHQFVLDLGQVEEVAEVWINDKSAGLVWNNPAQINISRLVKKGKNSLKVEVLNRWPNRMIGDFKLTEGERKMKSSIVTLPTAWNAPLETLPSEQYGLQTSGLLGPVLIEAYPVMNVW